MPLACDLPFGSMLADAPVGQWMAREILQHFLINSNGILRTGGRFGPPTPGKHMPLHV